jgi:integrase/recombinase XerC
MQVAEARERYVRWLAVSKDLSPHTIRAYESDIAALERYLGSRTAAKSVDHEQLVGFVEMLRARGLTPATVKRRASGVRGFCRWLVAQGLLDDDPWTGLTISGGRGRRLPRAVPAHVLERLLAALTHRAGITSARVDSTSLDRPHETTTLLAVALMLATGIRVNELVTMRCQDIDIDRGSVLVMGKGRRERNVYLTNDWLRTLICAYLSTRNRMQVDHDRLLFNRRQAPLSAAALRSRLLSVTHDAKLDLLVTPHMLRHSAATRLIELGVDIRLIQRLLGHASLTTTEVYTHVSDGALQRVLTDVDVLGNTLCRNN